MSEDHSATPEDDPLDRVGTDAYIRQTFEQAPFALVGLSGPEHTVVAANAAYRALLGRQDLIGRKAREVFPEAVGQRIFDIMDRIYATGEPAVAQGWHYQLELNESGILTDLYLDFSGGALRDEQGRIVGTYFSVGDGTERAMERMRSEQDATRARQQYVEALDEIARLQGALLPAELPLVSGLDLSASYLVAASDTAAGGDWFDAVVRPDGRVVAVVGDVVGHGVAASAVMGQLRAVMHERLLSGASIAASIEALDRFATSVPAAHAATLCAVEIDPETGAVSYCTAGHPAPLVVSARSGSRYLPRSGGGPLGTGAAVEVAGAGLDEDDVLLLYTDGILERPGVDPDRAAAELSQVATDAAENRVLVLGASPRASQRICQFTLELLTRETGHADDITLLAIQRTPRVRPLRLELVAAPAALTTARHALGAWLDQAQVSGEHHQGLQLAVSELVANAIEHGYNGATGGPIRVDASLDIDGVLRITVADDGVWRAPAGPPNTSGRGLWITGQLLDELWVDHGDDDGLQGTSVTVGQRLRRPALLASGAEPGSNGGAGTGRTTFATSIEPGPPRVLRVRGPIDFATVDEFFAALDAAGRGGVYPLVVDLSGVELLASAGVRVLFAARDEHALHNHDLVLVAANGSSAQRVLDLVGLERR